MATSIFLKDGKTLSLYGLNCGYVQRHESDTEWVKMYMEHSHIHVMSGQKGECYDTWCSFYVNELTLARKMYNRIKKMI